MNKLTTGAIATGAAVLLLLGGAGTFALWSDSTQFDGSSIQAGELFFGAEGTGEWTNVTNGGDDPIDINTFLMVPGNTLQFEQTVEITATGNDLIAELTYDAGSITIDPELEDWITITLGASSTSGNVTADGPNVFEVTPAAGTSTVVVTVTVAFDEATPDLEGQDKVVDLSGLELTLTQLAIP